MLVLIDNYDSFTYNVAGMLAELGARVEVIRNDAITVEEVLALDPAGVVLSPGPGTPASAGISLDLVAALDEHVPLLGICLGMQCIGAAFGARIERLPRVVHGAASEILHDARGIFEGLPPSFPAARYHSLTVAESSLPPQLEATARTRDGVLMGLRHVVRPLEGVQFHPESILTPDGGALLGRFVEQTIVARERAA